MTRIAYLPGDGIGREVLPAARRVLESAGFEADWVELNVGWDEWRRNGDALPAETLRTMRATECAFLGAVTSKGDVEAEAELSPTLRGQDLQYQSPILRLRRAFDLGINLRPVRSYPRVPSNGRAAVDLVLFRENTEGLYAGLETHPTPPALLEAWRAAGAETDRFPPAGPGTALSLRVVTRGRIEALSRAAFEHAHREDRHRVTLLEKANVLRKTGGLVREAFYDAAKQYASIPADDLHIDAACAHLVRDPTRFDVVVATNLFGDIFSDLAAEVAGGIGLAPSANLGPRYGLFEPVHGTAPDIAGRGTANPIAAVLAGALMARHLGGSEIAATLERAVEKLLATGGPCTPDLGGAATTAEVTRALERLVARSSPSAMVSGRN